MSNIIKGLVAVLALTSVSLSLVANALAAGSSGFPRSYAVAQTHENLAPRQA